MILVTDDNGTQWLVNEYGQKVALQHAASSTAWAVQLTSVATVDHTDLTGFTTLTF